MSTPFLEAFSERTKKYVSCTTKFRWEMGAKEMEMREKMGRLN